MHFRDQISRVISNEDWLLSSVALCCSHTLRITHLHNCIDATFSTAGILANTMT